MSKGRKIGGVFAAVLLCASAQAQFGDHTGVTQWYWEVAPGSSGKAGEQVELIIKADVAPGWIVYSSDFELVDFGPRAAKLALDDNPAFAPSGDLQAVGSRSAVEKNWTGEYTYTYFSGQAEFRQPVRLLNDTKTISGTFNGQTCYKPSGLCTLFREAFSVEIL